MTTNRHTQIVLALLACLPAIQLRAQSASGEEIVRMDDLLVTSEKQGTLAPSPVATKLSLSVRETPQAVTVIDRARMDEELMTSVNDVMKNVTGVYATYFDTQRPAYYARGFKIEEFQVDGMPSFSGSTNMEFDTALYERVEILRGAHGLMTGAGIPSAVINLQRKRPGKTLAASITTLAGSWDLYRAEADLNIPLTRDGRVRTRFVSAGQLADSFHERYSEKKLAWLGSIEADLGRSTTIGAGYQSQNNDPTNPIWGTTPRFASDGSLASLSRSTSFSANWTEWKRKSDTTFVNLDQKLGDRWNLRAAYNRIKGSTDSLRVYASGFPNLNTGAGLVLLAGVGLTDDTRDTVDVYLSGRFPLLGREHDLVVGWNQNNLDSYSPTIASITSGPYYYRYVIPDYRLFNGEAPAPTIVMTGASRVTTTDQSGFYATTRLRPIEKGTLLLGARLSNWETYVDNYGTTGGYTGKSGAYQVENELTPYLGLVYELNQTWSAYGSYTDIFRPQSYKDKDFELLSPVLGSNLEAGLKAEFFAKRFQVSFGVFETKQDNYGVIDASVPLNSLPDGSSAYIGVNGTKSTGFEVELTGFIRSGWTVSLGYSNIHTRRHALDLTYANIPEHLLRFHTNYQFRGALKRLSTGLSVNWQGEQTGYGVAYPGGTATVHQSGFALVNLNASYHLTDKLTLTASVRNALDKTYWATLDYANYGEPRAFLLSLRWRY